MHRYKVTIKRITYEGEKWSSANMHAENFQDCFRKIEKDYKLQDCLDYKIKMKELSAKQ